MANLGQIISEKSTADAQWQQQRQAERDKTTALQDTGIDEITTNPEAYAHYLDLQGDNPTYSTGNIALVHMQLPKATVFGTVERWKTLGRFVLDEERQSGAKIFTRGTQGRGYIISPAYDITQTQGRELTRPSLQEGSREIGAALRKVLDFSQVPVRQDEELPVPAFYDQNDMALYINPNTSDQEAFAAIATEIALVRFHNKGRSAGYSREDCELDAQSVSYILCRRFGIEREKPDMSRLSELYAGWPTPDRKQALDSIQDMSKMIGRSIEKSVTPQQRSRPLVRNAAR